MTCKFSALLFLCFFICNSGISQDDANFKTHTYYVNDSIDLQLDLFVPKSDVPKEMPLVLYVHGGGFSQGNRTGGHGLDKHLISQGIACASISYTLSRKGKGFGCEALLSEKVRAFQIAASQTWLATDYLLRHQNIIKFDASKIFLAGSSAGAETVLHAAFWDRDEMQLYDKKLSSKFKYAGVISGAGAIMDLNLITRENMMPIMMFHGDADPLVPFATASHHYCPPNSPGWLMFFGSSSIAKHLDGLEGIYDFTYFTGGGHKHAGEYFYQKQQKVVDFIKRIVKGDRFRSIQGFKSPIE